MGRSLTSKSTLTYSRVYQPNRGADPLGKDSNTWTWARSWLAAPGWKTPANISLADIFCAVTNVIDRDANTPQLKQARTKQAQPSNDEMRARTAPRSGNQCHNSEDRPRRLPTPLERT